MIRWSHLTELSLVLALAASPLRAVETYELIPADALGGVACKSIQGLVKKSEKLIKDVDLKLPDEAQPGALCKQLFMFLGIQTGLRHQGQLFSGCRQQEARRRGGRLAQLRPVPGHVRAFHRPRRHGKNFGFEKGKLKPETMTTIAKERDFGKICYAKGKHIYLGGQ